MNLKKLGQSSGNRGIQEFQRLYSFNIMLQFHFCKCCQLISDPFYRCLYPGFWKWGPLSKGGQLLATEWNKVPLHCLDSPSFTVLYLKKIQFISRFSHCPGGSFPSYQTTSKILPFQQILLPSFLYIPVWLQRLKISLVFFTIFLRSKSIEFPLNS